MKPAVKSYTVPGKPRPVADPLELVLQITGLRWIRMDECQPANFVEFIGLEVKGPHDFEIGHYLFDGSGNEGLEAVQYWWPCPPMPKRAVDGFPPHEHELGDELRKSLEAWIRTAA
jgi:hypothetical protein